MNFSRFTDASDRVRPRFPEVEVDFLVVVFLPAVLPEVFEPLLALVLLVEVDLEDRVLPVAFAPVGLVLEAALGADFAAGASPSSCTTIARETLCPASFSFLIRPDTLFSVNVNSLQVLVEMKEAG